MKDKFNSIDITALPKEYQAELNEIKKETDNFQDQEVMEIYADNFDQLYALIKKRYPEAIKGKKKIVIPAKKAPVKKKIILKPRPLGRGSSTTGRGSSTTGRGGSGTKPAQKDENCDEAIDELAAIRKKREEAAQKRADAPKKQHSTLAAERQLTAFKHAVQTSDLKDDEKAITAFAKDLAAVYKKHGMESIAEKILEAAKKKDKAEYGTKIDDAFENFDIETLDAFEKREYERHKQHGKQYALQLIINNTDGDYSQLSPALAKLAEQTENN